MVLSVVGLRIYGSDVFFVVFILGFILSVLYSFDLGRQLRAVDSPNLPQRVLGVVFGLPQAAFGIISICIGLALICWVLYNSFVERLPEYSGGFLTLGIGPLLISGGVGWLVYSFRGTPEIPTDDEIE